MRSGGTAGRADVPATTAGHTRRASAAIERLCEFAPASGALALWMPQRDATDDREPAADGAPLVTDGHTIRYRAGFETLSLPQQAGWVAHAVLHVALRHVPRARALRERIGDVDDELFNTCADAIVNSALAHASWLELPQGAVRLELLLGELLGRRVAPQEALANWDVEALYRFVDDRKAAERGRPRADGRRAAAVRAAARADRADLDMRHGQGPVQPVEQEAELAREWRERLVRAQAGDGEFALLRGLLADLREPPLPWEQLLRSRAARALAPREARSWSRPTRSWLANQGCVRARAGAATTTAGAAPPRRLPWEPGRSALHPVPRLVLVLDVSGSIDEELLARLLREVRAIVRRHGAGLTLIAGDDAVRAVFAVPAQASFDAAAWLGSLQVHGGGGTDFTPMLQAADERRADLIVVFTDLEGPVRHRPAAPVLWAVPSGGRQAAAPVAPFGSLLRLD